MTKAEITISRRPDTVWAFFTKPENWSKWHGGVMREVNPGWKKGATIVWAKGPRSTIRTVIAGKVVKIEAPYITTTFNFTPLEEEGATLVQVDFAPRGGATFSDGGLAHQATVKSQLFRLKQCVESETTEGRAVRHERLEGDREKNKTNVQKKWWQFWK